MLDSHSASWVPLGSLALARCVSWSPAERWRMSWWGLFHQAFSSQFGVSLVDNAASKPHPSNKFLALEGEWAPVPATLSPSGPREVGRKAPTGCTGPWGGKWAGEADSSLFIFCLACWTHSLVSAQGDWDLSYTSLFQKRALSGAREG